MKKVILIGFDPCFLSSKDAQRLGMAIFSKCGAEAILVRIEDCEPKLNLWDLSNLPLADIEEIRALIRDKVTA